MEQFSNRKKFWWRFSHTSKSCQSENLCPRTSLIRLKFTENTIFQFLRYILEIIRFFDLFFCVWHRNSVLRSMIRKNIFQDDLFIPQNVKKSEFQPSDESIVTSNRVKKSDFWKSENSVSKVSEISLGFSESFLRNLTQPHKSISSRAYFCYLIGIRIWELCSTSPPGGN